ncbi:Ser/Thr protein kinase RdoA (MazF antagonist) [Streptomyces pseudovenezuelae]|uniref:Ser/Thr protein kinase RdoA (MazF antagonist) n=1 Tax=Streptomyces pseudovenezuelae TaxID=67350 RepID=A0ABT6M443_9ACTN|nr:Ser/Thr protein kinase RdoA (MazF antagonist) [Streptomyces pseudovenezuelae]
MRRVGVREGTAVTGSEELVALVAGTLSRAYGIQPAQVAQIPEGTNTRNFRVADRDGCLWFAKVYPGHQLLERELPAVELAEFAREGGAPVPAVLRTREGDLIEARGRVVMSLWTYLPDAETAEGALAGERWPAVGATAGQLHRLLADHPAARPVQQPGAGVCDLPGNQARFERMITSYGSRPESGEFERWALEACRERLAVFGRLAKLLEALPELTVQILHGDLASPNVLLRGEKVAGIVDFQAPKARYTAWEIARIGCDPRSLLRGGEAWLPGLSRLLAAYRDVHPGARWEDLLAVVVVGCVSMLASTYPLAQHLDAPEEMTAPLEVYARARHEAALMLLDRLDEAQEVLRDGLR